MELRESGHFSEAWCETCGYCIQSGDGGGVVGEALAHEHPMLGQDVHPWKTATPTEESPPKETTT
jgi:hypothetical protein